MSSFVLSLFVFDKLFEAGLPINISSTPGKPNRIKLILALLTQPILMARLPLAKNPIAQLYVRAKGTWHVAVTVGLFVLEKLLKP
jgi:hypothetical protein